MTVLISRELLFFNFEHLDILCPWIRHPCEMFWPLKFSRASVDQFRASRYIMHLNQTSGWKVMTIWILKIFRCSISSVSICDAAESDLRVKCYDHWNFSRAYVVQFWACRYLMHPNMTSVWKVMTGWISWELLLFNFERLDILCAWIGHPSEKWWPFEFLESFRFSIQSISISDAPESDFCVKSYDHRNFSRAFFIQFRASRYVMFLYRTSVW